MLAKRTNNKNLILLLVLLTICWSTFSRSLASPKLLLDEAGLLSEAEGQELSQNLEKASRETGLDLVILTVEDLGEKTASEYADDFFDENNYGQNDSKDGVLFLVSMAERDWAISTSGRAIDLFSDAAIDEIADQVLGDLGAGNYFSAFSSFIELSKDHVLRGGQASDGKGEGGRELLAAKDGAEPEGLERDTDPGRAKLRRMSGPIRLVACVLVGLTLSGLTVWSMTKQLNTVKSKTSADDYIVSNSFNLTGKRDIFLYSHVSVRARPRETSSGSSSGGSSVHRSSSGRTHGGRSGKF